MSDFQRVKDLTVSVEDQPGRLADVGEALGRAGVNIDGLCAITIEGRGLIHLLVADAAAARSALQEAGITVEGEADPLIFETSPDAVDRPGEMAEAARAVANAGVNIQLLYMATKNRPVLVTSDNEKASQAVRS